MKNETDAAFAAGQEAGNHWGWDEESTPLHQLLQGSVRDALERDQQWQSAWRAGYRSVFPRSTYQLSFGPVTFEGVWIGRTVEEAVEGFCDWLSQLIEYQDCAGRNVELDRAWLESARAGRVRAQRVTHLRGIVFSAPSGLVAALEGRFPGVDVAVYTAPAEWDICAMWEARGGSGISVPELMTDIWRAGRDARRIVDNADRSLPEHSESVSVPDVRLIGDQ